MEVGFGVPGIDVGWPPGEGEVGGPLVAEGFGYGAPVGLLAGLVGAAVAGVDGAVLGRGVGVPGVGVGVGVSMQTTADGGVGEALLPLHTQVTPLMGGQLQYPEPAVGVPLPEAVPARGLHPAPPVGVGRRASQMVT